MRSFFVSFFLAPFAMLSSVGLADSIGEYSIDEPEEPVIWIEEWFDGCTELSASTKVTISKMTLDADCLTQALGYCTGRISDDREESCQMIFIDHLRLKGKEISSSLPAEINLRGFKLRSYENAVGRASKPSFETCDNEVPELECELLDVTLRWLDWRYAQRLLKENRE
ncbi:hypothetical protein [Ruegeria meonggei]|uniref:hypothetical protein n=1 Tax=Ruegeria meonggei TaxID=1446476 RepID=UPI00366D7EE6